MAANIDDLIDKIDILLKSMSGNNPGVGNTVSDIEGLNKQLKTLKTTLADSNTTSVRWTRLLQGNATKFQNLSNEISDLDAQFERLTQGLSDQERAQRRKEYNEQRRSLLQEQRNNNVKATFDHLDLAAGNLAKNLGEGAARTAGNFVRDLQGNSSGVKVASNLLVGAIDTAQSALSGVGTAMAGAGTAAMALGGRFRAIGAVLATLGIGLSGVTNVAAKLAKFGIEVLSAEVEKTITAFQASTNAGALFVDGMTGLRTSANAAGLTVDQFSKVLTDSSRNLSMSGVGIAEAARTVGRVGTVLRNSGVQDQLLRLGYSFEDQASITAEVMSDMRRLGGTVTDQQLARGVQTTAENFRLLGAITGEDVRKKTEQVRQQNQIMAFQGAVSKLSVEQQGRLNAAMSGLTEMEQRALRDRMIFGGQVRDKEAALFESIYAGTREKNQLLYEQLRNNELSADSVASANARYGKIIGDSAKSAEDFNRAAYVIGGTYGNVAKGGMDAVNQAAQYTQESVDGARTGLTGQKNAMDALTSGVVSATKAVQDFRLSLEQLLTPFIGQYAQITAAMLEVMKKYTDDIQKTMGSQTGAGAGATKPSQSMGDKASDFIKDMLGLKGIENMGLGEAVGRGMLGALGLGLGLVPGVGIVGRTVLGAAGGIGGGMLGDAIFGKRALGGPVLGNRSYLVGENGPELYRPSTSGSILNNPETNAIVGSNSDIYARQLVELVKEQLSIEKQNIDQSGELVSLMTDLRTIQQQLYNSTV